MLKIRCFSDFKGAPYMLVIAGKEEDYLQAATYLANKEEATLTDPNFAIYYETKLISRDLMRINKKECMELAEIFMRFGSDQGGHYHNYYDI